MSTAVDDVRVAISYLVLSVRRGNPRAFLIVLSKYTIAGTPYRASMFTVSPSHVAAMAITPDGFGCIAKFPTDVLSPKDRASGRAIGNGIVEVELTIDRDDILAVQMETSPESGAFEPLYG